jgi:nicotinamidase-related amidase
MAARHARELGFMPIVIGDACGTVQPLHDRSLEQLNDCYAPVLSTAAALGYVERVLAGRRQELPATT